MARGMAVTESAMSIVFCPGAREPLQDCQRAAGGYRSDFLLNNVVPGLLSVDCLDRCCCKNNIWTTVVSSCFLQECILGTLFEP